jgi:GNAT superfamily N-acetyltransferase
MPGSARTCPPAELPERTARLKDGRVIVLRHGRPGDEAGIARLVVAGFPLYRRAARGDFERAASAFAQELGANAFVVAALAEYGGLIGATCISGRGQRGSGRIARLRRKLAGWGLYGLACFGLEKLRSHLCNGSHRARPGELYRYLTAVDVRFRSQGVARQLADFVDDYARAAGHHIVLALHDADNVVVLALHRKRGCTLVELPRTRFSDWLRQPTVVMSRRELSAPPAL